MPEGGPRFVVCCSTWSCDYHKETPLGLVSNNTDGRNSAIAISVGFHSVNNIYSQALSKEQRQ